MIDLNSFIEDKVLSEYQDLFAAFRKLVVKEYPELQEEMRGGTEKYYGVPVYRLNRIVITVSPTKKGITFAFSEGGQFEDKYKALEGVGKKTLNLRLSSLEEFDEAQMKYYIDQAIALDKK